MAEKDYLQLLANLQVDLTSGHPKPHKPCLLLAVIDLIAEGVIQHNRIYFDEALKSRFSYWFAQYRQGNDKDDPSQPFFYLRTKNPDKAFWHHQPAAGYEDEYIERSAKNNHASENIVAQGA